VTKHSRTLFYETPAGADAHPGAGDLAVYIDSLRSGKPPQLPAVLVSHVENCRDCQEQILDVLFYLQNPLPGPDALKVSGTFPSRKHVIFRLPAGLRAAAALFAFVVLLSFYFFLPRGHSAKYSPANESRAAQQPGPAAAAGSRPEKAPVPGMKNGAIGPALAVGGKKGAAGPSESLDAFAVNPNLESMVDSRSRSLIIQVHSPANSASLPREIAFSWKEFSHEPLSLTIVTNRNETVFSKPVANGRFLFSAALPPGCYYWKLESASELYYVGKFFVPAALRFPEA
jgi:hypothetical protein